MADLRKFADFNKSFNDLVAAEDYPTGAVNVKVNTVTANKVVRARASPFLRCFFSLFTFLRE